MGYAGQVIGSLFFGWLGERIGRIPAAGITIALFSLTSLGCVFADSYQTLLWLRFIQGLGLGGETPVMHAYINEFAKAGQRARFSLTAQLGFSFGILGASLASAAVLAAFKSAIQADIFMLDYVWRLCIGIGVIPAIVSIYFRVTMPETPRYKMEQEQRAAKLARGESIDEDKASWADFYRHFSQWRNLKILLGTSIAWFALDVAFYGVNLNNAVILKAIGFAVHGDTYEELFKNAVGNVIIALLGTVPGYWVTVFTVDRLGRKFIQVMGFSILTVLFLILGVWYQAILNTSIELFIAIFTLTQFFTNFGPNATTFIIPGEVFPTRYRSTAHGISAASGKLGAIVAQVGFSQLKDIGGKNAFVDKLLIIFAVFMFIGLLVTFLIPETKGKSLEEINDEYTKRDKTSLV